jgi:hypothetical protein
MSDPCIRVGRGEEIGRRGKYAWSVPALALRGISRTPLLDACRALKSLHGDTGRSYAAIYREGHDQWDMRCPVDFGAGLTVRDGGGQTPHFAPYFPYDASRELVFRPIGSGTDPTLEFGSASV